MSVAMDKSTLARRRRVLLHYPVLNRGGAERSTLRLLGALADRDCEVHLVLTVGGGALEREVDPRVIVYRLRDMVGDIPRRVSNAIDAWRFLRGSLLWAFGRMQQAWRERRFADTRFDAAIAGLHGMSPSFVCDRVPADRRLVMVRNDAADDSRGRLARNVASHGEKVDRYICVSQSVRQSLVDRFPRLASKAVCVYNLIDPEGMRRKAIDAADPFGNSVGKPRVLSVCRLEEGQKALLRMVDAHRRLLDSGVAHSWHVIGDGPDRELLERDIASKGVQDTFVLHGTQADPFPFYKHADVVAVLSRYEGLCGVVNEARILERPVVATRFAGIAEQIVDGVNGLIVEQDVDSICEGIARLLGDEGLRRRLAHGGYPAELLDDGAKLDLLLSLIDGRE